MTLVYRSILTDSDGAITAAVGATLDSWLESKGYSSPDLSVGEVTASVGGEGGPALVTAETLVREQAFFRRFRLIEQAGDEQWTTTVTWPKDLERGTAPSGSAWISIDLDFRPSPGSAVRRPGSPRLVRDLMAAGEAYDGPVPLTAESWKITAAHVPELAAWIKSDRRTVPILVFAADGKRAYDQERLARLLARDLAGVAVVAVLADGAATEQLANSLPPDYAVYAGGLRTYLPGVGGENDDARRHRVLGRASIAALKERAFPAVKDAVLQLSARRRSPLPQEPANRGAAVPLRVDTAQRGPAVEWLRERLGRIGRVLGRRPPVSADQGALEIEFDKALGALLERAGSDAGNDSAALKLEDERAAGAGIDALDQQRSLYDALLSEADAEQRSLREELEYRSLELDDLQLDITESAAEVERLERRTRWLERQLAKAQLAQDSIDHEAPFEIPASVAEVIEMARERLSHVWIGDTDQNAAELDLTPTGQAFAIKTWQALQALDAYARARAAGEFAGSFLLWCQSPPPGMPALSANAFAPGESETVDNRADLRGARVFQVPPEVTDGGEAYMAAHIRIAKRTSPAPRLHFLDDAAGSGKVYVGYIGRHLPTARFA